MKYGHIPGIDKPVPRLIQGTSTTIFKDPEQSLNLLDAVFELGCTAFDTAHGYGEGMAERTLGRWLARRGVREQVVIITKGAHHNQDRKRVTPFDITADLFDSLARLKTDYIDLYLLHRDDPDVPVGPIVEVLNEHLQAGHIRAFGGSNWQYERVKAANDYAQQHGLTPFAASSPNFSLAEQVREPWPDCITISGNAGQPAREWYAKTQMPVLAWSSLALGFFSGQITRQNVESIEDHYLQVGIKAYASEENFQRLDRLRLLAEEKGVSVPQIALTYVLNQPLNIFALVGANRSTEFEANLVAGEITLSSGEIAWLELKTDQQ